MVNMLQEALSYAKRGWYVFPCREKPGQPYQKGDETITPLEKTPYVSKGLNDATLDEEQIVAWWNKWANALIGINAGKSGLFVVDIDKKHVNGLETFQQWNINDSGGLHSFTPSGGMHIIFKGSGKSSTNAKTGIDTRGDGGYFIVPPSNILEGVYSGEYKKFGDWGKDPGVIPDGLMGKLFPDSTVEYVRGNFTPLNGVKKQLSRATLNFLANGAMPGERNATLFKVIADFAGCGYTQEHTKETLLPMCTRIGLDASEFEQVLIHAYSKPRTSSIPDSIQEKIVEGGRKIASKITIEEESVMEDALLACLLVDNSLIPVINDVLNFEDFQVYRNRIIYKAIIRLYNSGIKVDYVTTCNEVDKETNKISLDDISKMINLYGVFTENVSDYAYIIKEKASIRKLETVLDNKTSYMKSGNLVEILNLLEKDISNVALYGGARSTNVLTAEQASMALSEQTRKMANGEINLLKTGFLEYDRHVKGLFPNDLLMLAARSGDGKSALALSIINHVSLTENKPSAFFSLEMSTNETVCRLICQLTGLKFADVYQGDLNPEEWNIYREAMAKISGSKIYFDDTYGITVPELRSKIRKLMEKDIALVVIDQLEQVKGYEGMATHVQLDKISYDIKNMTNEFNVPIILNHQLNRGSTDRKLKNPELLLSDLNQAGEKAPDQIWGISHNKDEAGNIMQSKIKMLKNRNGPKIEFAVIFLGDRMLFSNPTREEDKYVFHSSDDHSVEAESKEFEPKPFWAEVD